MKINERALVSALVVLLAGGCAREANEAGASPSRDGAAGSSTTTEAAAAASASTAEVTTTGANPWALPTTTVPAPPVPVIDPLAKPAAGGSVARAAAVYAAKCAPCHGAEARADTTMAKKYGMLDFRSGNVRALTAAELSRIMIEGRGTVSEEAHPGAKLTEGDVRDMIAFIQSLK